MFHDLPPQIQQRMAELEALDAVDRQDGTPIERRLRQIPPETGRFLALLLANAPMGTVLEIGTSVGYSSLWLSLACRLRGDVLTTFEVLPDKAERAAQTFQQTGVEPLIHQIVGDARQHLDAYPRIAFCFLDAEKEIYQDCYDLVVPNLVPGGLLAADNATSHPELRPFIEQAIADQRVDSLVVPIGKGVLLCRKI